jgi:negative regulator of flagellin synthesis FlgM
MKIGPFDAKPAPTAVTAERKSAAPSMAAPKAEEGLDEGATVKLSGASALGVDSQGEGSFDAARVERITQAIRDGTFKIDAGAIADKLIANARELLDRQAR